MLVDSQDYSDPAVLSGLDTTLTDDGEECKGRVFACTMCSYRTDRKNNLKRHTHTMHEQSQILLECCGLRFLNKAELRLHTHKFHRDGYHCDVCGRVFCRKALLKRHYSVHSGYKEFSCQLCGYETSHKSNLERHLRVHRKDTSASAAASTKSIISPSAFPHMDFNSSVIRSPEVSMQTSQSPSGMQLPFVTSAPTYTTPSSHKQLLPSFHHLPLPPMFIETHQYQKTSILNTSSAPLLSGDWASSWQRAVQGHRPAGIMVPPSPHFQGHSELRPQVVPYWTPTGLRKTESMEELWKGQSPMDLASYHPVLPAQRDTQARLGNNFSVSALLGHDIHGAGPRRFEGDEEQEVDMKLVEESFAGSGLRKECSFPYEFRGKLSHHTTDQSNITDHSRSRRTSSSSCSRQATAPPFHPHSIPMGTQWTPVYMSSHTSTRTFTSHPSLAAGSSSGPHTQGQQQTLLHEDSGASSGYGSPSFEESPVHRKNSLPNGNGGDDEDEIIDVDGDDDVYVKKKEGDGTKGSQLEWWEEEESLDMEPDTEEYVPKKLRVSRKFKDIMGSLGE